MSHAVLVASLESRLLVEHLVSIVGVLGLIAIAVVTYATDKVRQSSYRGDRFRQLSDRQRYQIYTGEDAPPCW